MLSHAFTQFESISDKVDLNFRLVSSREDADIVFYYDTEIDLSLEDDSTTFGLTVSNYDFLTGRRWVEIFLNAPALNLSSPDFQSYVFNHELMHALGLEHPFDGSDGDYYLSTDFNKSAFPTILLCPIACLDLAFTQLIYPLVIIMLFPRFGANFPLLLPN